MKRSTKLRVRLGHLLKEFNSAYIEKFPRVNNAHTDALATLASAVDSELTQAVEVEFVQKPSIETLEQPIICNIEADLGVSWMEPIVNYLRNGSLPDDTSESYRIRAQASRYWLSAEQKLYKRSFSGPYLRCVHLRQV